MAMSLSAKVLSSGLKTLAFIAGRKRARLNGAEPIFVIGVRERPEVPLTKCLGVTPAQAANCRASLKSSISGNSARRI